MPIVVSIISLGLLGLVAPKLAFLMVAIAFGAAGAELFRKHLREDRTEVRGVADVLPYGFLVADGTVLNKDGALSRGILFRGPDGDGITPDEKAAVAEYIGNAFAKLGDGWGFHVDEVRRASQDYPAGGAFPDAISRLVDQERRASYEMAGRHYESDYYMVATYVSDLEEYFDELDEAWERITVRDGHTRVVLSGHSTGGLIVALWAHERQPAELSGLVLNSPWLDLQGQAWLRSPVVDLIVDRVGRRHPLRALPREVKGYYGRFLDSCFGCVAGVRNKTEPVQLLTLSGLASGKLLHGTLSVDTLSQPWWGFWGGARWLLCIWLTFGAAAARLPFSPH